MLIRTEAPADILFIDKLLKNHATDKALSASLMSLREDAALTLSLVACSDEGKLIGHVAFTPLTIDGFETSWQVMTPITVNGEYSDADIKQPLIADAMSTLGELGYPACFGFEQEEVYSQFGFHLVDDNVWGFECIPGEIASQPDWVEWVKSGNAVLK